MSVDPPNDVVDLATYRRRQQYAPLIELGLATPQSLETLLAAEDAIAGTDDSVRGMLDVWAYVVGRLVARKTPPEALHRLLTAVVQMLQPPGP